jgi:hypothetical protein
MLPDSDVFPNKVLLPIWIVEPLKLIDPVAVNPDETVKEFKEAFEPLTMTFFQLGISSSLFVLRLDTYTYAVYMPTSR